MTTDLRHATACELANQIQNGTVTPSEVVEVSLRRIEGRNEDVNAFITVVADHAREQAREADRALKRGDDVGPLHGVPLALKDLTGFREGLRHTFGCRLFSDNVATHTAVFVQRLENAGAIVVGKTNTPEFGHRPITDNLLVGSTSTPFELARNSGGSSGGSAAAVAEGMATIGQGSDAAGSIRIPAACCGVYGLKPSFGRIPKPARPNPFQYHSPFIDKGVLTRSVADAAVSLNVMAGPHPRDPFSLPASNTDYQEALKQPIDDWSIAYSPDLGTFPVSEIVREHVADALSEFEQEGATVDWVDIDLGYPLAELAKKTRFGLMQAFSAKIADSIEHRNEIDFLNAKASDVPATFRDRIEKGRRFTTIEIGRMNQVRTVLFDGIQDVFEEYDLLVTPTLAVPPLRNDSLDDIRVDGEPVDPQADWLLTWPFNMTGHPAASIPAAFVDQGPLGLQLVGPRFGEKTVLAASAAFERRRPWIDSYRTKLDE